MRVWLLLCLCVGLEDALYRKQRRPCPAVVLNNGRVRFRQKSGFAQFQCFKGYLLAGEKYTRCVNGQWDSPRPKCVRASCQKIKPPANGLIHASHRGAVLNFFCRPGFELNGPNMTSCDGRVWDTYLPTCLPTHVTPSLSCDFETEDLCGWSHDLNHNFDWTRMNFKTPSGHVGTGPTYDHTKGENGNGYYIYIESSSRNVNDTARLISPVYERQDNDTCLEFYYHMYGMSMGQLRVYVKKISEPWIFQPEKSVFWKNGNHGDQWLKSWMHLGPIDEDFQIIFEGVRGTSYISDIAIDDVKIIENCAEEEDVTTTTESETITDTIAYGTCMDRCDTPNNVMSSDALLVTCDCDDTCVEKNTCCADYIAICVLGDFSTDYTDYFAVTSAMVQNENATGERTIVLPSAVNVTKTTSTTTVATPTTTVTSPTTTATTPTTTATTPTTTTTATTTTTSTTTMTTPTTTVTTPKTTRVTTPSTIKRAPPTKERTLPTSRQTIKKTRTTPTTKTTEKVRQVSVKLELINDIATLPSVAEQEVSVPIMYVSTTEIYEYVETSNSEKAATIKEKPKEGATGSITIIVISVCSVIVGVLFVVFIAKRYSRNNCLRMKKMKSGNGDSQSDVRFLTSDEMLDFSLATPDDYNTL